MSRRLSLLLCFLVASTGCTFLNDPDESKIRPSDGGMDAPMDADAGDADAGDADAGDAGDGGPGFETVCDDNIDNDGDGLTDCADFECSAAMVCCGSGGGTPEIDEQWDSGFASWDVSPVTDYPQARDGALVDFRETGFAVAIVSNRCVPLALGLDLHTSFRPVGGAESSFAALVLTPSEAVVEDSRLTDDLAVEMTAAGALRVKQNGSIIAEYEESIAMDELVDVDVAVAPGIDAGGRPAIFASVEISTPSAGSALLVDRHRVVLQDELIDDRTGCGAVPGLFLGIEGRGHGVEVGGVDATARRCVNPRQFGRPDDMTEDDPLTPAQLTDDSSPVETPDPYVRGGFAAPALVSTCTSSESACWNTSGSDYQWDVLYEATNVDMELEDFTHVGYAIGHSRSTSWDGESWSAASDDGPKIGHDPPTCLEGSLDGGVDECADARSIREPTAYPFITTVRRRLGGRDLLGAYARELEAAIGMDGGVRGEAFGIHVLTVSSNPSQCTDGNATSDPFCDDPDGATPDLTPGPHCVSVRDPELVPKNAPTESGGELTHDRFWLLYTCEHPGGSSDVRVVDVDTRAGITVGDAAAEPLLSPGELGAYASGGIRGAEAVIDFPAEDDAEGRPVVRLWFVAQDDAGNLSIGLAQGERQSGTMGFPTLVPFPANPVLRVDDDVLGGCPGDCALLGFDVVSRADNPPPDMRSDETPITLRFLVARRVNDGSGVSHEMVPLEQSWKPR